MESSSSRQQYPSMLDTLEPSKAVSILNDRMKQVGNVNTQIADWLQERRRIEEIYAANLRKLAQKQPPDESSDLGVFTTPWQKITSSIASLAESHHLLASRIEADVEKPLRNFTSSNRDVQAMSTMQGNLQALAKDYEGAQKKADKLNNRGGKAGSNKVANASSDFENASSQWTSQAPYVFEALQAVDESRCNHLRDVLTQYETLEVDLVERGRRGPESALNSLLNVDTANEIRSFATRQSGAGPSRSAATRNMRPVPTESSSYLANAPTTPNLAPPSSLSEDIAPQRSPSVGEEKKSRLSGLRRLGTVVSRRKSMQPSFDRRQSGRGASSSNLASIPSNEEASTPSRLREDPLGDVRPPPGSPPRRPQDRSDDALNGFRDMATHQTGTSSQSNGVPQLQEPLQPQPVGDAHGSPDPLANSSDGFAIPNMTSDPISVAQQDPARFGDSMSSQYRATLRDAPIAEDPESSDTAMASTLARLREQAAQPRRTSTQRGRRDVRNTIFMPSPAPLVEEQPSQSSEGGQIASSLNAGGPLSTSALNASPQLSDSPFGASLGPAQPSTTLANLRTRPSLGADERGESDTRSIRSGHSLSTGGAVIHHPNQTGPGISSSIVETMSVWQELGSPTRATLVGELALANNVDLTDFRSSSASPPTAMIRLENFSALEKVAPNPGFIKQLPDRYGEYNVDLSGIARTSVAFKYQVHIDSSNLARQAVLLLTPNWKIEPTQASVIVTYAPNPHLASTITLTNVLIAVHLEGRATTCLSKPAGTFSKERSVIYWKLPDLVLSPNSSPQKLLARFQTGMEAKPGQVEARWEMRDDQKIPGGTGFGSGLGVSKLDVPETDPFADSVETQGDWREISTVRKLVSGTYVAS